MQNRAELRGGKMFLPATCRARGATVEVDVLDLSAAGCMVFIDAWPLRIDDRVLIKLPGLADRPSAVRWVNEKTAGFEFDQPLYAPVLDHLVASARRAAAIRSDG